MPAAKHPAAQLRGSLVPKWETTPSQINLITSLLSRLSDPFPKVCILWS